MSEKIRTEFIKKFREETAKKDEKEMNKEKEGLGEETKREIGNHLQYVKNAMLVKLAYRRKKEERAKRSLEKGKNYEKEERFYNDFFDKAKAQLAAGKPREEILQVILKFPTQEEQKLKENLSMHKKWLFLKRGYLDIDINKLPITDISRMQMESYKKQIKSERDKRKEWAKQLIENWEKRNRDLIMS